MANSGRPSIELGRAKAIQERPVLKPPRTLSADARKVWRDVQAKNPHLRHGHFSETLEVFCMNVVRARQAQQTLDAEGLVVETTNGSRKAHPAAAIMAAASSQVARYSVVLGLSPASRKQHVRREKDVSPAFEQRNAKAAALGLRLA